MQNPIGSPQTPTLSARQGVMSIPAFRKLWNAMAFSSFGDWLGLLATTALETIPSRSFWVLLIINTRILIGEEITFARPSMYLEVRLCLVIGSSSTSLGLFMSL